jgi:hypothetical protein
MVGIPTMRVSPMSSSRRFCPSSLVKSAQLFLIRGTAAEQQRRLLIVCGYLQHCFPQAYWSCCEPFAHITPFIVLLQSQFSTVFRRRGQSIRRDLPSATRGGEALLVLQNSFYKEIEIELSRHYCELGKAVGLKSKVLARNPVRRTMTTINSRSSSRFPEILGQVERSPAT